MSLPFLRWIDLLTRRRLLAIDPGTHGLKILYAESFLGRVRILRQQTINLQQEGLHSSELSAPLGALLAELGRPPAVFAMPQHATLSQVIDLPPSEPEAEKKALEQETVQLSGLSETPLVYDAVRLKPFGRLRNPFWLTLCQENRILERIDQLGLGHSTLCEITTSGNALIAAYRATGRKLDETILANIGAQNTELVILMDNQGVYATSIPVGRQHFIRNADLTPGGYPVAEEGDFDTDAHAASARFSLDEWLQEVHRIVREWNQEQPRPVANFRVVLSGGGAKEPGLLEALNRTTGSDSPSGPDGALRFELWPSETPLFGQTPGLEYIVAFGTLLEGFDLNPQPVSLLPASARAKWAQTRSFSRLLSINGLLLAMTALALAYGTWHKYRLARDGRAQLSLAQSALSERLKTESLARELSSNYDRIRPILDRQKYTLDTLQTLRLLQQARSNQSFSFVLFADQQTYVLAPDRRAASSASGSNAVEVATNSVPALAEAPTIPSARRGFVAEVFLPEAGERGRRTLTHLVEALKKNPLFKNVDSMPAERRKIFVDPKLADPEHHFALEIELAENPYAPIPRRPDKSLAPDAPRERSPGVSFHRRSGRRHLAARPPETP